MIFYRYLIALYYLFTLLLFVYFRQNSQSRENINFPEDEVPGTAEGENGTGQPSSSASPGTSRHWHFQLIPKQLEPILFTSIIIIIIKTFSYSSINGTAKANRNTYKPSPWWGASQRNYYCHGLKLKTRLIIIMFVTINLLLGESETHSHHQ